MLKTKQKAWAASSGRSLQPSGAPAGHAKSREGQACARRSPVGPAQTLPFIHYLLGVAQTILFEQSVSGESRAHLGLRALLCPCGVRYLLQLQRQPQGRTRDSGSRAAARSSQTSAQPRASSQAASFPALLSSAESDREQNPGSLLLRREAEEGAPSLSLASEKPSLRW